MLKLIRRITDDQQEENSSLSSARRKKTERFYKDTILSFKSLIKSINESDMNARMTFEDQKSLTVVMPADFNSKISNFFEHEEGVKETTIYEFYYCMKFILIQPRSKTVPQLEATPPIKDTAPATPMRKRSTTIDMKIRESERDRQLLSPRYL